MSSFLFLLLWQLSMAQFPKESNLHESLRIGKQTIIALGVEVDETTSHIVTFDSTFANLPELAYGISEFTSTF